MSIRQTLAFSLVIGLAAPTFADQPNLRRYNQAQALDLKIRQRQSTNLQKNLPPSEQRPLQREFQRQRFRQQSLQQRQLQERGPAGTPPQAPGGLDPQFKQEQKAQQLDFKIMEKQQVPQSQLFDFHMEGSQ